MQGRSIVMQKQNELEDEISSIFARYYPVDSFSSDNTPVNLVTIKHDKHTATWSDLVSSI
jgi:hypothetical protein